MWEMRSKRARMVSFCIIRFIRIKYGMWIYDDSKDIMRMFRLCLIFSPVRGTRRGCCIARCLELEPAPLMILRTPLLSRSLP